MIGTWERKKTRVLGAGVPEKGVAVSEMEADMPKMEDGDQSCWGETGKKWLGAAGEK